MLVNVRHNWKRKFALHCDALRKNKRDQATVGTSKESMFLRAFDWNRNRQIPKRDRDISEKNISKKSTKFPENVVVGKHPYSKAQNSTETSSLGNTIIQKYRRRFCRMLHFFRNILGGNISKKVHSSLKTWKSRHWETLLFKSRDNVFMERCVFFQNIILQNISEKKAQNSPKTSALGNTIIQKYIEIFHFWIMVLPNDGVFQESTLNNGVTQWRCFRETLGFFSNVHAHRRTLIFFSANKRSFAPFCSFFRCSLW